MSWLSLKYSFAWALSYHLAVFTYFCVLIFLSVAYQRAVLGLAQNFTINETSLNLHI